MTRTLALLLGLLALASPTSSQSFRGPRQLDAVVGRSVACASAEGLSVIAFTTLGPQDDVLEVHPLGGLLLRLGVHRPGGQGTDRGGKTSNSM